MAANYNFMLIAISLCISLLGAFTGLRLRRLALTITNSAEKTGLELMASAVYGGIGIWSTHFLGMLALAGDELKYDSSLTLLSLGFAVLFSFAGFKISYWKMPKIVSALTAAIFIALATLTMFLSAMKATSVSALLAFDMPQLLVAFTLSLALASIGIFLSISNPDQHDRLLSPLFLAAAASSVHFLAVGATTITPRQNLGFLSTVGSLDLASVTAMLLLLNISLIGMIAFIFVNVYQSPRLESR